MGYKCKSSGDVRKLPLVHLAGTDHLGQPWHQVCDNAGYVILNTWDCGFAEWLMKRANRFLPMPAECKDHKYYEFECQGGGCQQLVLRARHARLLLAAFNLVERIDQIRPDLEDAFICAYVHGGKKSGGPEYVEELDALRRELGKPSAAETFWEDGHTAYPLTRGDA